MPITPLLIALQSSLPDSQLLETLRADADSLTFGLILVVIGVFALVLAVFRRPVSRLELLAFGLFAALYGGRLIAEVETTSAVLGLPPQILRVYVNSIVTYFVPVPFVRFLELSLGRGWKGLMRLARQVFLAYAVLAVLIDAVTEPFRANEPYQVLVVVACLAMLLNLTLGSGFDTSRGTRSFRLGCGFLLLTIVNENLVGLGLVPWELEVEAPVVLGLVCWIGYAAARRGLESQRQLDAIEHELGTARRIQSSILPRREPVMPSLDIAARQVPMTAVGGDFYEFLPIDDTHLGVLVADVSGHGVPAALIASMLKIGIASQVSHASSPAAVLSGLYETFHERLEHQFITVGYAFLDLEQGVLRAATAGHPPLLVHRRRTATVERFGANGFMIGFLPASGYEESSMPLEAGDRILLYSDGVTEATDRIGEFFDEDGLRAFALAHPDQSASRFADALLGHLAARAGHAGAGESFDDDLTLVVVDVRGRTPSP